MADTETKKDRFVRIAEARTNKIINMIQLLGNCSNKSTYDYDENDVEDIFNAIDKELKIAKQKFSFSNDKQTKFKLNR